MCSSTACNNILHLQLPGSVRLRPKLSGEKQQPFLKVDQKVKMQLAAASRVLSGVFLDQELELRPETLTSHETNAHVENGDASEGSIGVRKTPESGYGNCQNS